MFAICVTLKPLNSITSCLKGFAILDSRCSLPGVLSFANKDNGCDSRPLFSKHGNANVTV